MRTFRELHPGGIGIMAKAMRLVDERLPFGKLWLRWPPSAFSALRVRGCERPSFSSEHTPLGSRVLHGSVVCAGTVCGFLATVSETRVQQVAHGWISINDFERTNAWCRWIIRGCDILTCLGTEEEETRAFPALWSSDPHRWARVHAHAQTRSALNVSPSWIFVISLKFVEHV